MLKWTLEHPWMTFFIVLAFLEAVSNIVKYLSGYHADNEDEDNACSHGYDDWEDCPVCRH